MITITATKVMTGEMAVMVEVTMVVMMTTKKT